ncbi:MAG: tRNA 2-thiouridine(34) synthase MnmA [Clostridia bacterium]|nr:tRNA 2-thiouridine(34) synthase MnmA [Clostridia bacterium]
MRILLGMSGGVDSTYAAHLLSQEGYEVEGAVLVMSEHTDTGAALRSCEEIGIKLNIVDATKEFEEYVVKDFINQYSLARTPNPCVMCNRYVKIKLLCDYSKKNGFDKVATGHYCNIYIKEENLRYCIQMGNDLRKDQSYMLWQLTQEELAMLITPLSEKTKDQIYKGAKEMGFASADMKESQEICFIPDNDYASFIEKRIGKFPQGDFIDSEGNTVGRHKGIIHYTIGQRKGLGLAMKVPVFVTEIDPQANTVKVEAAGNEMKKNFVADTLNFQLTEPPAKGETREGDFLVKIRYGAKPAKAHVIYTKEKAEVFFEEAQRAITPGQSSVFYVEDKVAFGGFIC